MSDPAVIGCTGAGIGGEPPAPIRRLSARDPGSTVLRGVPTIPETTPEPVHHANGMLPRLSTDALNDLLSKLRDLRLTWTVGEVDAIARKLGWPLSQLGDSKLAGLDPKWGLNQLEITIPFEGHRLKYIGARLTLFTYQPTPDVREQIQDAFAALTTSAIRHLGEPTYRLQGTSPQVQWRGEESTLALLRHPQGVLATLRPNQGQDTLNRAWVKAGQVTVVRSPQPRAEVEAPPKAVEPAEPTPGGWRMIDREQATRLLQGLRALRWDWTPAEIPAVTRALGWTITRQGGSSVAASAGFGLSDFEALFSTYRGNQLVELISVHASETVGQSTLESQAFIRAAFGALRAVAVDLWGAPTHDADGLDPASATAGFVPAMECRWAGEDSTLVIHAGELWLSVRLVPNRRLAAWDRRDARLRVIPDAPPWPDADWADLAAGLAAALPDLRHGATVILRSGHRFVRFRQDRLSLSVETHGCDNLRLDEDAAARYEERLFELGWSEPRQPGGREWWRIVPWPPTPADARRTADLLVATLHDVHGVARPADLTYQAFELDGGKQLTLAALTGLRRE
jgi:Family of unknown function (DUF6301)